jgi:hypothetical protein
MEKLPSFSLNVKISIGLDDRLVQFSAMYRSVCEIHCLWEVRRRDCDTPRSEKGLAEPPILCYTTMGCGLTFLLEIMFASPAMSGGGACRLHKGG